jgi:hypothetical protein
MDGASDWAGAVRNAITSETADSSTPTMPTTMPTIVARNGSSLVAGGSPAKAHTPKPTQAMQSRTRVVIQPRLDTVLNVTGQL